MIFTGVTVDLRYFCFRDFVCVNATDSLASCMYLQHDARRRLSILAKEYLNDVDYEIHGSVVIIDEYNLVQRRAFEARLGFLQSQAVIMLLARLL